MVENKTYRSFVFVSHADTNKNFGNTAAAPYVFHFDQPTKMTIKTSVFSDFLRRLKVPHVDETDYSYIINNLR